MSVLHIFRGLPGSGKTTAARKLAEKTGAILIEPDAILMQNGDYIYTPERFEAAIKLAHVMVKTASQLYADIIYADVLPKRDDVFTLISYLYCRDMYRVVVHDLKITAEESKQRNKHNVAPEDIDRMAEEWEDW